MRYDLLRALNDLAYIIECAALDYTGELKSELSTLCDLVRAGGPGYDAPEIQASIHGLEGALNCYRLRDKAEGISLLFSVSRGWWAVTDPRPQPPQGA